MSRFPLRPLFPRALNLRAVLKPSSWAGLATRRAPRLRSLASMIIPLSLLITLQPMAAGLRCSTPRHQPYGVISLLSIYLRQDSADLAHGDRFAVRLLIEHGLQLAERVRASCLQFDGQRLDEIGGPVMRKAFDAHVVAHPRAKAVVSQQSDQLVDGGAHDASPDSTEDTEASVAPLIVSA